MSSDTDVTAGPAVALNRFQIRTKKGLEEFLKVIHSGFLDVVDPRGTKLVDLMIENDLLTESDQESLSGKGVYVRRDQARKLWFLMHKMRVEDFTSVVLGELCSTFPHILPAEWTDHNPHDPQDCLRHDIMEKIRPATMADRLYSSGCLSFQEYSDLMEMQIRHEGMWGMMFEAMQCPMTEVTSQAVRGLLERRRVQVPDNFQEVLTRGTPCTCGRSGHGLLTTAGQAAPMDKINTWLTTVREDESTAYSDSCSTTQDFGSIQGDTDSLRGGCLRFLLLGRTRSGKSATGNTILGEKLFKTDFTVSSVTSDCVKKTSVCGGRKIEIMDCPGLCNTTQGQRYVTIMQAAAGIHPGPHAILYVVGLGRYTAENNCEYTTIKTMFGESICKYMIVLFTFGDMLDHSQISIEDVLKNGSTELQQVLRECDNRYIVFNNMADDPQPQVERLLSMVTRMVAQNGGQSYSCPRYAQNGGQPYPCPQFAQIVMQSARIKVAQGLLEKEKRERLGYLQELCKQGYMKISTVPAAVGIPEKAGDDVEKETEGRGEATADKTREA